MKRLSAVRVLIAGSVTALLIAISFTSSPAEAQTGTCSLNTVRGTHAAQVSGWVGSGSARVPYSEAGFVSIDGHGNITGESTFSLDGVVGSRSIAGTYTVDPETCTGEATSSIGTFFFVIGDNGKQMRIVGTTPGTTVHGESIRQ